MPIGHIFGHIISKTVVFKRRKYPAKVMAYVDNLLLVGINYDKEKKIHECQIEEWQDNQ